MGMKAESSALYGNCCGRGNKQKPFGSGGNSRKNVGLGHSGMPPLERFELIHLSNVQPGFTLGVFQIALLYVFRLRFWIEW